VDYEAISTVLQFKDGETRRSVTFRSVEDTVEESTKNLKLELDNPTGGSSISIPADVTITIMDDDRRPFVPHKKKGGGSMGWTLLVLPWVLMMRFRRVMLRTSKVIAVVAGILLIPISSNAEVDHSQHLQTSNVSDKDPHAAHRQMVSHKNLRRTKDSYQYQNLYVTDMSGSENSFDAFIDDSRPVIINFIFTTCTTICPIQAATFAQVQRKLGGDAGTVAMISISIDPEYDTPARLREYAERFRAGPQWQFLTGSLQTMIDVQKSFDAYNGAKMNHRPLTLIKAPGVKEWIRLDGMASAADIVSELEAISEES